MVKYYRTYNSVYENIGNNTLKCIASFRKNMVGVLQCNYNQNDRALSNLYPFDSKEKAIESLKQDAYWDNAIVYEQVGNSLSVG